MAGVNPASAQVHKKAFSSRIAKDETAVQAVLATLSTLPDIFTNRDHETMRNISSGVRAPDDVANDLLKAYSIGEEHFRQFI